MPRAAGSADRRTDSSDAGGTTAVVQSESWRAVEQALVDHARSRRWSPIDAVAQLGASIVRRHDLSLEGAGLRLFERRRVVPDPEWDALLAQVTPPGGEVLGRFYERLVTQPSRRRSGLHITPVEIARRIIGRLDPQWRTGAGSGCVPIVLDPAAGGAVFLLAAADALVAAGVDPSTALAAQRGLDLDPSVIAIAEAALAIWSIEHGLEPQPAPGLTVGDGLLQPLPRADVIVGNPPFLSQLRAASAAGPERRAALRDRWGDLVGAYTDEAWLFLAASAEAVAAGGQVALVQPISVLAARHGAAIRARIADRLCLRGLWIADGPVFEAVVEVCAPFLVDRSVSTETMGRATQRWTGPRFDAVEAEATEPGPEDWGRSAAVIAGGPVVRLPSSPRTLGDLAGATAGFRDQFYGFAPHVVEATDQAADAKGPAQLVTVGMIDPFRLRWGESVFRFAGSRYRAPVVDLERLEEVNPQLAQWVRARNRPKLLVATQTRMLEAWADPSGAAVPATPVISVEPDDPDRLFAVAAVVMAPVVSADAAAASFGTAMSVRAIKVAASQLSKLPLPVDRDAWQQGARLAEELHRGPESRSDSTIGEFAAAMNRAYGIDGDEAAALTGWWRRRWPRRD